MFDCIFRTILNIPFFVLNVQQHLESLSRRGGREGRSTRRVAQIRLARERGRRLSLSVAVIPTQGSENASSVVPRSLRHCCLPRSLHATLDLRPLYTASAAAPPSAAVSRGVNGPPRDGRTDGWPLRRIKRNNTHLRFRAIISEDRFSPLRRSDCEHSLSLSPVQT